MCIHEQICTCMCVYTCYHKYNNCAYSMYMMRTIIPKTKKTSKHTWIFEFIQKQKNHLNTHVYLKCTESKHIYTCVFRCFDMCVYMCVLTCVFRHLNTHVYMNSKHLNTHVKTHVFTFCAFIYMCLCAVDSYVHSNTLPKTATHCNALQQTAPQCNSLQHTSTHSRYLRALQLRTNFYTRGHSLLESSQALNLL